MLYLTCLNDRNQSNISFKGGNDIKQDQCPCFYYSISKTEQSVLYLSE